MEVPPRISVVIAALNVTGFFADQLGALADQDHPGPWELIVADNGSGDDLAGWLAGWREVLPRLRIIDASARAGQGYARSVAVAAATAPRVAICDADDIVAPGWLAAIDAGLDHAAMVTGPIAEIPFDRDPTRLANHWQTAVFSTRAPVHRGVPYVPGCNAGYRTAVLGAGFSADYGRAEDGATSLAARRAGHALGWCPEARVLRRGRPAGNPQFARAVASGVGLRRLDREFADLLGDPSPHLARRMGWLAWHLGDLRGPKRGAWIWEAGATLGAAVESVAPGRHTVWRARRRDHGRAGLVAAPDPDAVQASR